MQIPEPLRAAIAEVTSSVDARELTAASANLTERYKQGHFASALTTAADRAAYLAVRMPATYAACAKVASAIRERMPDAQFQSLLDLGAGPGTAMLAFAEAFGIEQITCVERSQALVDVGSRVGGTSDNAAVRSARWITGDIGQVRDLPAHHVVVCSYVLGELGNGAVDMLIRAAWLKAGKLLVIIEPGTPDGFRRVHTARSLLLESGGHVVAPCPHQSTCPMFVAGDWCHFPARVERSAEHRRLKGGALGYEDEKFSYIIGSKKAAPLPDSRVLRHPLIHPGHLRLALCRPERTESKTVTKSQKALWRYARKLAWGDEWQPPVADTSA